MKKTFIGRPRNLEYCSGQNANFIDHPRSTLTFSFDRRLRAQNLSSKLTAWVQNVERDPKAGQKKSLDMGYT